jgi:hypothetical protein
VQKESAFNPKIDVYITDTALQYMKKGEGDGMAEPWGGDSNRHTIAAESSLRKLSKLITFRNKNLFSKKI